MLENRGVVVAIAHDLDVARVVVRCGARRNDLAADILAVLSEQAAPVDLVARSNPQEHGFWMSFTMSRNDSEEALSAVREALAKLDATIHVDEDAGKVSLIGMGLLNRPEHTARMLSTLAAADIPTSSLSTSQIRTSVIVPRDRVVAAVQLLHNDFELDSNELDPVWAASA